jgi:hypothetical protein
MDMVDACVVWSPVKAASDKDGGIRSVARAV